MCNSIGGAHAGVDVAKLNNILMQLRKNCNHPDLLTCEWEETVTFPTPDVLVQQCGKMQVLDRLLSSLRAGGHRVLIFSQVCSSSAPFKLQCTAVFRGQLLHAFDTSAAFCCSSPRC